MRGLLDTSVVLADDATDLPEEAAISAATLAELHRGVHLAKNDLTRALRVRRLAEIESRFSPLAIDPAVARSYGQLAQLTVSANRMIRPRVMDLLIAATAHAHRLPLYTRNRRDFEPLAALIELREA